jgi:copper chaperone
VTFDQVELAIQNAGKQVKGGRVIEGEGVSEVPVEVSVTVN